MIAYLDSSVLLRLLLKEANPYRDFDQYSKVYSSRLMQTEVLRVLQRTLLLGHIDEQRFAQLFQEFSDAIKAISIISLKERVFRIAEGSYSKPVGTLDGLHLATALILREAINLPNLVFLTHDEQLASAAMSLGFVVKGVS